MQVSATASAAALVDQIGAQETTITSLEGRLGTGQAITRPSDNPDGTVAALALQSQISQAGSWRSNLTTASSWLGMANQTATSVVDSLQQARTIMLQAMNQGTQSPDTYQALSQQLSAIRSDLLGAANTTFGGRPIFAGTSAGATAYDSAGAYQGAGPPPSVVVGPGPGAGQTVDLSVTGPEMFGSAASSAFSVLAKAAADLTVSGGPSSAILHSDMSAIGASLQRAVGAAATLGNLSTEASARATELSNQTTELQTKLSSLLSVDIPQVTTQLNSDLTTYQAALWAASKAIPPSLVEYL